jgi:hypothetical protein
MHEKKLNRMYSFIITVLLILVATPAWAQGAAETVELSWVSILPPLLAILLALSLRQVIPALSLASGLAPGRLMDSVCSGCGRACLILFKNTS